MTDGIDPGAQFENEKSKSCVFQSVPESREEILKWSRCEKLRFQRKMESQGTTVPLYGRGLLTETDCSMRRQFCVQNKITSYEVMVLCKKMFWGRHYPD